jgi:hypothetical protein
MAPPANILRTLAGLVCVDDAEVRFCHALSHLHDHPAGADHWHLRACEIDPEMASEVAKMADIAAMQLAWRETLISTLKHEQLHSASSVASSLVLKI